MKKIIFFFKILARNKKIVPLQRRNGRAVECGGLENRCTAMYRGFESLFLRGDEATESRFCSLKTKDKRQMAKGFCWICLQINDLWSCCLIDLKNRRDARVVEWGGLENR